jgi:phage terminase large subunit-like protein
MKLTSELVESFAGIYLSPRYDSPQPTPDFHRECWGRYCSDSLAAATAAPRNHAKSTGLTHDYGLAAAVFNSEDYIIVVGSSEEMAIEHLNDIANELRDNEELIRDFKIKGFLTDQRTDIIVERLDGTQFRFLARGAEQKIRGRKWNGKRPGLIICDDLEDDEQVENVDRRKKFRKWFFRACKQSLRDGGKIRVHGTILHDDSLLNRLMRNKEWNSRLYKAHEGFDDFSNILWPEKFSESRLRQIRQEFINEGDPAGYSQEYLNDPRDNDEAYLREADFIPMKEEHFEGYMRFSAGWDFAISKADTANKTSVTVGGMDLDNVLNIIDLRSDRLDSKEIVDQIFLVENRWKPDTHYVEGGQIWKAIEPMLLAEMRRRSQFLSYTVLNPIKDKKARGRPFQKRHRSGGMRWNMEAPWYAPAHEILMKFTGDSDATHDDEFDSTATLCMGVELASPVEDEDSTTDEELEELRESDAARNASGRSSVTGY